MLLTDRFPFAIVDPALLALIDEHSREQAARMMDDLCVRRDITQVDGTADELAALLLDVAGLKESIAVCGCIIRFDRELCCHVVVQKSPP